MTTESMQIHTISRHDSDAFDRIVTKYRDMVFGLALNYLNDFDAAYDISQEVFLRAFLHMETIRDQEKLSAWIRTVTQNACRMWLRQKRPTTAIEQIDRESSLFGQDVPELPDTHHEREERRQIVLTALSHLSEANRQALTLYYLDERPAPEIALFLGVSHSAVRQRLHRARQQLKQEVLRMVRDTLHEEAPDASFNTDLDRLLDQAKVCFRSGDFQSAISPLEEASKIAPTNAMVTMVLADAYTRNIPDHEQRDNPAFQKVRDLLDDLVAREPENIQARIRLAQHTRHSRSFEEDLVLHQENVHLSEGTPYEPLALLNLARLYTPRRMGKEARACYEKLMTYNSDVYSGIAAMEMGISYYLDDDIDQAILWLNRAADYGEKTSSQSYIETARDIFAPDLLDFYGDVDERLSALCHIYLWLAGFFNRQGNTADSDQQFRKLQDTLAKMPDDPVRETLVKGLLNYIDGEFRELTDHPAVHALKQMAG